MPPDNQTSQTLGKLEAQVEGLGDLLAEIRRGMAAQVETLATTKEQISQLEHKTSVVFKLLSGTDGSGGIQARIASLESKLETTINAAQKIEKAHDDQKKLILKVLAVAVGGSMAGGAGVSKILGIIAGN